MKRVRAVFGGLSLVALLGVFLLCYWLIPHKHSMVRRAERGDVQAMYEVGMAHLSVSGYGIIDPRSPRDPVLWLRRAAERGHVGAMWELAGIGIPNEEKVMWLKKGAELGSGACMSELAKGYLFGMYGLTKDQSLSDYWFDRAEEADRKGRGLPPKKK